MQESVHCSLHRIVELIQQDVQDSLVVLEQSGKGPTEIQLLEGLAEWVWVIDIVSEGDPEGVSEGVIETMTEGVSDGVNETVLEGLGLIVRLRERLGENEILRQESTQSWKLLQQPSKHF